MPGRGDAADAQVPDSEADLRNFRSKRLIRSVVVNCNLRFSLVVC